MFVTHHPTQPANGPQEWTEAVTRTADAPLSDSIYSEAREQFSEKELVGVTCGSGSLNAVNRPVLG